MHYLRAAFCARKRLLETFETVLVRYLPGLRYPINDLGTASDHKYCQPVAPKPGPDSGKTRENASREQRAGRRTVRSADESILRRNVVILCVFGALKLFAL
jgi:hypothetical protein